MMVERKTVGEPVYENSLFHGICGIVYKKEISDKIREIQEKYLNEAKEFLLDATNNGEISLKPWSNGYYYGILFGSLSGFYANQRVHKKLDEMKRPFRKEVKDIIMRNSQSCYTYNWTMSDYVQGETHPAYLHYTNPYEADGEGAWKPELKDRLKYIEPSAKVENKGDEYLYFEEKTLSDKIKRLSPYITEQKEFYICSFDEAKELVEALYQESLKNKEAVA